MLRKLSQDSNTRLADIAYRVVDSREASGTQRPTADRLLSRCARYGRLITPLWSTPVRVSANEKADVVPLPA